MKTAPTITSSDTAAVLQGAGPGTKVYQVTADDSQDVMTLALLPLVYQVLMQQSLKLML